MGIEFGKQRREKQDPRDNEQGRIEGNEFVQNDN
jgi:hypothetical protein